MIPLALLAHLVGLLQLFVIASFSRTIRWRAMMLAFTAGIFVSAVSALAAQQFFSRALAAFLHQPYLEVDQVAKYAIDPFIEELFKAAPLILIVSLPQVRRRLGIADMLLMGAALGAGFGFTEETLRLTHWVTASSALWNSSTGSWAVFPIEVPGLFKSLGAWLPNPAAVSSALSPGGFEVFGRYFELADFNVHLVWSAIAGLGIGLFFRLPHRRFRWLALLLVLWVACDHAFVNYVGSSSGQVSPFAAPLLVASALGGFGQWMPFYALLGLILAKYPSGCVKKPRCFSKPNRNRAFALSSSH